MWEFLEQDSDDFLLQNESYDLDLDSQNAVPLSKTVEPPSNFILPLLWYQKEWLVWSLEQENSSTKGGILADEIGMGKTVQPIALVELQKDSTILSSSSSTSLTVLQGTLVVCPVIGAMQWFHEIESRTTRGSNKTLVYHGANRENIKCMYKLAEYDFVITMYHSIEADSSPTQSKRRRRNSKHVDDDMSRRNSVLHSVKWNHIILDELFKLIVLLEL